MQLQENNQHGGGWSKRRSQCTLRFSSRCGRIHAGVAERTDVQVFRVRVQRHYLPVDGVEDELIEERVVGLREAVDVLVRYGDVHLQVLTDLPDHLDNTAQTCKQTVHG